MKLRLATLNGLLLLTLSVITAPVWALSFNQIFVFGDSFSDTGNNAVPFDTFLGKAGKARTDVEEQFAVVGLAGLVGVRRIVNNPRKHPG